jgi:hypothetical protein
MTEVSQARTSTRWVLPFLAALIAALAAILLGTTASASAAGVGQTRVGAFNVVGEVLVGPPEHITAGQRLGEAAPQADFVVATGVAANTEKWAYRGVGRNHPGYADALKGKVNPRNPNGTATPEQHNLGNTTDSPYTSWTRDPDVARRFAGPDGVVLRVPRGEGSPYKFEWSPDVYYEQEILIRGPVCGAQTC